MAISTRRKLSKRRILSGWTAAAVLGSIVSTALPADEGEDLRRLEEATVAFVQPGFDKCERNFNLRGGRTEAVRFGGMTGRRAADWFSLDLPVDDSPSLELIVTYGSGESADRFFAVLIDGEKIAEERIPRRRPDKRETPRHVLYRLRERQVVGKKKVTVRFEALEGRGTGTVYGLRVVRAQEHLE